MIPKIKKMIKLNNKKKIRMNKKKKKIIMNNFYKFNPIM